MQNGQMQNIPLVWYGPAEGYAGTDRLGSSSAEKALGFLPNSRVNKSQQCVLTERKAKSILGCMNSSTLRRLRELIILLYSLHHIYIRQFY